LRIAFTVREFFKYISFIFYCYKNILEKKEEKRKGGERERERERELLLQ